jgi:predicted ABC-type exoprotein transport system permease subunit
MEELRNTLETINWTLILPLIILQLILVIIALIDWTRAEQTNGSKWIWLLIILFISLFGPILYFIFGRRRA